MSITFDRFISVHQIVYLKVFDLTVMKTFFSNNRHEFNPKRVPKHYKFMQDAFNHKTKGQLQKTIKVQTYKYIINSLVSYRCILSILSADAVKKSKKKRKKPEPNDDSHEDEESSIIQSAKLQVPSKLGVRSRSSKSTNKSVINRVKQPSIIAIKNSVNDANNNNKILKVCLKLSFSINTNKLKL